MFEFQKEEITTFEWSELEGKTLKIHYGCSGDCFSVIGVEQGTGQVYLLITEMTEQK